MTADRKGKPMFAQDSERLVVFSTTSKKPLYKLLRFFAVSFMVAVSAVCFMAPVLDKFFDWIDASIINALIVFLISLACMSVFLLYLKFKE